MRQHLGYPTVTQGHWLTGLTPVARPNKAHMSHPYSKNHPNPALDQTQTNQTPLIMWKVHVAHDREHGYHDSLHSTEVTQLYPQVGDSITCRWLRVSVLPNIHFLRCTAGRSPHSLSQRFPARKTSTLRFHRCGLHHPTEAHSCAKARITPFIT
jgi:hypothetical protein